jgi:hypothetical protein
MHHGMWMVEGKSKQERKGWSIKSDGSLILSENPFPTSDHSVSSFAISIHPRFFFFFSLSFISS